MDIYNDQLTLGHGWHDSEIDPEASEHFRWTEKSFSVQTHGFSHGAVLCLDLLSYYPDNELTLEIAFQNGRTIETLRPRQGRRRYCVELNPSEHEQGLSAIVLRADREVPREQKTGDLRELAVRLYRIGLHASVEDLSQNDWFVVPTGPTLLSIETSSRCNLRCVMCRGTSDPSFFDRPQEIAAENVEKVLGLAGKSQLVSLSSWGEPLLSNQFFALLDLLCQTPPKITFYSNGSLIDERILSAVRKGAIHTINFSLDAATERTYRLIRNFDFGITLSNIRRVIEEKRKCGSLYPKIHINMTLMRLNIQEAPLFMDLAKDLGVEAVFLGHLIDNNRWSAGKREWIVETDDFTFDYRAQLLEHSPSTSNFHLNRALDRAKTLGVSVVLDRSRAMFFPETKDGSIGGAGETNFRGNPSQGEWQSSEEPRYCAWPWEQLRVRSDGTVWFCCFKPVDGRDVPVGTLAEVADLEEIWNGRQIRKDRAVLALNGIPQACVRSPCWYRRLKR